MLILLPPSEEKSGSGSGPALDLASLSLPQLTAARSRAVKALVRLCAQPDDAPACAVLGLSPGLRGEVGRNAALRRAPAVPAGQLYTGVLYDALELSSLSAAAHRFAQQSILVFSGLWGAVRISDRIPAYRCSIGVKLPELGGLAGYWRRVMAEPLAEAAADSPVLDLRSTAYAAMWTPTAEVARRTAVVRVLHERVQGGVARRTVVSHFNKATKGRLVRSLAMAGAEPQSLAELTSALRDLKYTVEEHPRRVDAALQLDVITTEL